MPCVAEVVNRSLKADCTDFNNFGCGSSAFPLQEKIITFSQESYGVQNLSFNMLELACINEIFVYFHPQKLYLFTVCLLDFGRVLFL